MTKHVCKASTSDGYCGVRIDRPHFLCPTHWEEAPEPLRNLIWTLYRKERGSIQHRRAVAAALKGAMIPLSVAVWEELYCQECEGKGEDITLVFEETDDGKVTSYELNESCLSCRGTGRKHPGVEVNDGS